MIENNSKGRLQEDIQYLAYSIKTWRFWQTILLIIIGSLGASVAINGILVNNNFFDGGVSGISLLIFYLTDWPPLGVIYFSLNIPIFIVCWREMSLKFVIVSLLGAIIFSTALVITKAPRPLP